MKKRELSGEERALWRRIARTVKTKKPLPPDEAPAEPGPAPLKKRKTAAAAPPAKAKPATPLAQPVADRGGEKKVRRGDVEIGMKLDLHGHTQDSARAAVHSFLLDAQARGERAVLIVTGKGRAGETGVLKRRLPDWLEGKQIRPLVAGIAEAHQRHGGSGAVYVFVKKRK
ncbi:MAG: Smr/MutS family protein [Caulobacterales bacterium]